LPLLIAMIVAADLITLLLTRRIANREIPWSWQPKWPQTLRLVAEAAPLGISALFVNAYYRLDTIVLRSFSGYSAVGFYSIAYRATESFLLLSTAFSTSIYPILSEQVRRGSGEVSLLFRRIFCPVVSAIALVALVVSIVSEPLIARFLPRYLPSAIPIAILIWSTVFMFANSVTGTTINSLGWQRLFVRITGVNLTVNVILNLLLIPRWQIAGACVATVATEMVNFLQQAWALRSVTGLKVHRVWILAGVAAGGAYLVRNVASGSIPLLLIVLLSVAGASELLGYYRGFWNSLQISRGWNADGQ
jgi:O-antigen/teichoic acid export membrane protein